METECATARSSRFGCFGIQCTEILPRYSSSSPALSPIQMDMKSSTARSAEVDEERKVPLDPLISRSVSNLPHNARPVLWFPPPNREARGTRRLRLKQRILQMIVAA